MDKAALHNEKGLLLKIAEGDERAFGVLFNNYRDKIYSIALELTHAPISAEEIVQDVFMIIWKRRQTLPAIQHFTAYLFTIARNEVYATLKRESSFDNLLVLADDTDTVFLRNEVDDFILNKEYENILQTAIYRLSPQQQQVYRLIKENSLKREEAAAAMQISPETVKSYLTQAMRSIRAYCLGVLKIGVWIWLNNYFF
jgi:RNA polymerase sigma-70 factor (ECF subfamily)